MRTRYRRTVPLSLALRDLLGFLEPHPEIRGTSPTSAGTVASTPVSNEPLPASTAVPAPGCLLPFAASLLALLLSVTVLPRNAGGQPVFFETFDGVTAPALPAGWSVGEGWVSSGSSASDGSGLNNLVHTGTAVSHAMLPVLDLSGVSGATLGFLARRTSSYPTESMRVTASLDGGSTWPIEIMATGTALPVATSTWEPVQAEVPGTLLGQASVLIRFEVAGGTTSGANVRLDDVLVEATSGGGSSGSGSTLGFGTGSSVAASPSTAYSVGVRLDVEAATSLGAFQFDVAWDSDLLFWGGAVPGASIADAGQWTISWEPGVRSVTILVLAPNASSLAPGVHDPILDLVFDVTTLPDGIPRYATLSMSNVIGALAAPTGDDAGLTMSTPAHLLTIMPAAPEFVAPASVDLGIAAIGQTVEAFLTVSNETGYSDLQVGSVATDLPVFGVSPSSTTVPAGMTFDFTVTYTPDGSILGPETTLITFTHDGSNGPATVVQAFGQAGAGRGDANGDAAVDLLDLLVGIDLALGRNPGDYGVQAALDLHPFPAGNTVVDVRDLTVLAHAIVQDAWPDGRPLPVPGGTATAGKASDGNWADALLSLVQSGDDVEVMVDVRTPIRGVQLELLLQAGAGSAQPGPASAVAPLFLGSTIDRVRLLWTRLDGELIPEGPHCLAFLRSVSAQAVSLGRSLVVNGRDEVTAVTLASDPGIPAGEGFRLGALYPNPFPVSSGMGLHIPVEGPPGHLLVVIVDVLGREVWRREVDPGQSRDGSHVTWWGRDSQGHAVSPGLYFVRGLGAGSRDVRPVVVAR